MAKQTNSAKNQPIKPYLIEKKDDDTGELTLVPKYLYIVGSPRQYRFNGQNGQFTINGDRILLDGKNAPLASFSFQPIVWRIFEENMFGREKQDKWCELFFIDAQDCVSSIMFNNTTLDELTKLATFLYYDRITLADVVLTVTSQKVTSKKDATKSWFVGKFSYEFADKAKTAEYRAYADDYQIYRQDTLTETAKYLAQSDNFHIPEKEEVETAEVKQAA